MPRNSPEGLFVQYNFQRDVKNKPFSFTCGNMCYFFLSAKPK